MSYQIGAQCYETLSLAIQARAAQMGAVPINISNTPWVYTATFIDPSSIRYSGVQLNGTGTVVKTVVVTASDFPTCGLIDYPDAIVASWLVVACWVAAFAFTVYRRSI